MFEYGKHLEILKRGADAAFKTALIVSYRRKDNASSRKQTTIDMWYCSFVHTTIQQYKKCVLHKMNKSS